jgi:hypothetical protein
VIACCSRARLARSATLHVEMDLPWHRSIEHSNATPPCPGHGLDMLPGNMTRGTRGRRKTQYSSKPTPSRGVFFFFFGGRM